MKKIVFLSLMICGIVLVGCGGSEDSINNDLSSKDIESNSSNGDVLDSILNDIE